MSHSTAMVDVEANGMKPELTDEQADTILREAVAGWYANEADRYDDARVGTPFVTPLTTPNAHAKSNSWGDVSEATSLIVPICADAVETSKIYTFNLSADELAVFGGKGREWEIEEVVREHLPADVRSRMTACSVMKKPAARKPVARTTEGRPKTVYRLVDSRGALFTREAYDSIARAKAAALKIASEPEFSGKITVRASVIRENGDDVLAVVERPIPEHGNVKVKVSFERPSTPTVDHFIVMFDYHS